MIASVVPGGSLLARNSGLGLGLGSRRFLSSG